LSVECSEQGKSLAAFFAFGLFGEAGASENQDLDGYYDPKSRSCFMLKVELSTMISTNGLPGILVETYGTSWMSRSQSPDGFFYDIDIKPSADNLHVGDWYKGEWVTRLSCEKEKTNARMCGLRKW
jgi:hypothetical protein